MSTQVVALDPSDSLRMRQAAVPEQQPGATAWCESPPWNPLEYTAHIQTSHNDPGALEHELSSDYWRDACPNSPPYAGQQTNGSVRLNVLVNVGDATQQADIIKRLMHRIIGKHDSGIGFSITVSCQGHLLNITRQTGKGNPVQCSIDAALRPTILAAYLTTARPASMVLEGYHLDTSKIWCFKDGEKTIEYLRVVCDTANSTAQLSARTPDQQATLSSPGPAALAPVELPDIESILRCADQQQKPTPSQQAYQTVTLQLPEMLVKGGRYWLQAELDNCTSSPLALPTYSTVLQPNTATQQQANWRRYMYPAALLRKARYASMTSNLC